MMSSLQVRPVAPVATDSPSPQPSGFDSNYTLLGMVQEAPPQNPRSEQTKNVRELLREYLGHGCDNFCLLWKDQSGKHKYIKSQNQDTTLLKICKNFSGLEGGRACTPEVAIKEDPCAEEEKGHFVELDLVRKFGSHKPKKKPLRSPPRALPTLKRRKSSAAKKSISPLALGNLYGRDDESEDSDEFEGVTHEYNMVKICDEDTITHYYHCQLVRIGGNPLKKILKAWIKDIQPKKQGSHPYNGGRQRDDAVKEYGERNGGELTKPDWWPPTTGWPSHGCRHREPDHLLKPERLILAVYLLRSHKVRLLRQSTREIASALDEKCREGVLGWLEDIYCVREQEENYEDGGRDPDSMISMQIPVGNKSSRVEISYPKVSRKPPPLIQNIQTQGRENSLLGRPTNSTMTAVQVVSAPAQEGMVMNEMCEMDPFTPAPISTIEQPRRIGLNQGRTTNHFMDAAEEGDNMPSPLDAPESELLYRMGVPYISSQKYLASGVVCSSHISSQQLSAAFNGSEGQLAMSPTALRAENVLPQDSSLWWPTTISNGTQWNLATFPKCTSTIPPGNASEARPFWPTSIYPDMPEAPMDISLATPHLPDRPDVDMEEQPLPSLRRNDWGPPMRSGFSFGP